MALTIIQLVSLLAFASVAIAARIPPQLFPQEQEFIPDSAYDSSQDSYQLHQLPLNLQLPKEQPAQVPFFSPEPSAELKAPQFALNSEPDYYQVPIPADDLVAPIESVWNPNNDPKYFYEVPAAIAKYKQDLPTSSYPKKYNNVIHSKDKPFSSKPKQEIVLKPIDEASYVIRQKELHNVFQKLAKKENQKQIQSEKQVQKNKNNLAAELDSAETGFQSGFDSEGVSHQSSNAEHGFNQGLSAQLISSLGIPASHAASTSGERLEFHMVGHDGPHSYKWGFDTGKGHNRQFRFEERDKEGIVKGHYGFYDKHGKLQMVNYDSHPHDGFHAEGNFGKSK